MTKTKQKGHRHFKLFLVFWAFIENSLFSGLRAGWSALVYILKQENIYGYLCEQNLPPSVNETNVASVAYAEALRLNSRSSTHTSARLDLKVPTGVTPQTFVSKPGENGSEYAPLTSNQSFSSFMTGVLYRSDEGGANESSTNENASHFFSTAAPGFQLFEGSARAVTTNVSSSVIGCAEQDAVFNQCFTVATATMACSALLYGHLNYRYGIRTPRVLSVLVFCSGALCVAFIKPGTSWLIFPGLFLTSSGGMALYITNNQISYMFTSGSAGVVGLLCGALEASAFIQTLVKIAYENGVSLNISYLTLAGLYLLTLISTFFFLPKDYVTSDKQMQVEETLGSSEFVVHLKSLPDTHINANNRVQNEGDFERARREPGKPRVNLSKAGDEYEERVRDGNEPGTTAFQKGSIEAECYKPQSANGNEGNENDSSSELVTKDSGSNSGDASVEKHVQQCSALNAGTSVLSNAVSKSATVAADSLNGNSSQHNIQKDSLAEAKLASVVVPTSNNELERGDMPFDAEKNTIGPFHEDSLTDSLIPPPQTYQPISLQDSFQNSEINNRIKDPQRALLSDNLELANRKRRSGHLTFDSQSLVPMGVTPKAKSLCRCIWSKTFLLYLYWASVVQVVLSMCLGTFNPWLEYITGNEEGKVSEYTDVMLYSMLGSPLLALCIGLAMDALNRRRGGGQIESTIRTLQTSVLSLGVTSVLSAILCALMMAGSSGSITLTCLILVIFRTGLYSCGTAFLRIMYPTNYFGLLCGIMSLLAGCISFVQYPLFVWVQSKKDAWVEVFGFLGLLGIASLAQPAYLFWKSRQLRQGIPLKS